MYSILGKQVMSTSFSSTGVKDISLPKLSTGMYIIQLETATGKLNKKIVLE
jgi:O-acetyl-ADP-ribose deacetylase (regulator of RNase III)